MAQYKKYIQNVIQSPRNNQPLTSHRRTVNTKISRSKDQKNKLYSTRSKQMFLTDTQTSDYTKSSNQCAISSSSDTLTQTIKKLKQQNHELKQQIVQIKSSQYFSINQDKLKNLLVQNEKLKNQIYKIKQLYDDSCRQREVLQIFNKDLKTQYHNLTIELKKLTKQNIFNKQLINSDQEQRLSYKDNFKNVRFDENNNKRIERYSVNRLEEMGKSRNSHRSQKGQQRLSYRNKQESKSRNKQHERMLKKSRSNSRILDNEYFAGKEPLKHRRKYRKNEDE